MKEGSRASYNNRTTQQQKRAFSLRKRNAYRAIYKACGWSIHSRKYNEPTPTTWSNIYQWSSGTVFDASRAALD